MSLFRRIRILSILTLVLNGCNIDTPKPYQFEPSVDDAVYIRRILKSNGITIGDNDPVGKYLGQSGRDYWIKLPIAENGNIILTDDINKLYANSYYNGFYGIIGEHSVDTVKVMTDSIVIMNLLNIRRSKNGIVFDPSIGKVRVRHLWLGYEGDHYPMELMQVATPPYKFNSLDMQISIRGSTTDTLVAWVRKHYGDRELPFKD